MKILLNHATAVDPVANTCSTTHHLSIFVNAVEQYADVIAILQQGIDALKALDPKKKQHRVDVVLSVVPIKAPPPPALTPAKKIETELKQIAKEEEKVKKSFFKKKLPKDAPAEELLQEDQTMAATVASNAAILTELEKKKAELALLQAKLKE